MFNLSKYISELLLEHNCVIVPELGAFISNYKHSFIQDSTINPPSKTIAFNGSLKSNDGLLIHYIAQKEMLGYQQATEAVESTVKMMYAELKSGNKVVFNKIGELKLNQSSLIEFQPYNSFNFFSDSYGLAPVKIKEIIRRNHVPVGKVIEPPAYKSRPKNQKSGRKIVYYSLTAYMPIFILLWAFLLVKEPFTGQMAGLSHMTHKQETQLLESKPANEILKTPAISDTKSVVSKQQVVAVEKGLPVLTYYIIGGCFQSLLNAENFKQKLQDEAYTNAGILTDNQFNRVYFDSFKDQELANKFLINIQNKGISSAWILKQ